MTGDLSQAVNAAGVPAPASQNGSSGTRELDNTAPVEPVELCRLTVLADSVQVDLALPTDVPISVLVPGIVGLLNARAGAGGTGHETAADRQGRPWVLSKIGRSPLHGTMTLDEASIRDGEILVLGTADSPAPPPLFDDLMYAVATTGHAPSGLWTARTAQLVGFGVGAFAIALACLSLLESQFGALSGTPRVGDTGISFDAGIGAATAAVLFLVAGSIVGRIYGDDRTGIFLSGCALPLMFTSGVMFVPGSLGAPHLLLGAAATGAGAVLALRLGAHGYALFTAMATASAIASAAAATASFTELPLSTVGAGVTLVALAALATAPRLSMMQARLPLPPVPTAGASLDEVADEELPTVAELESASGRARSYLTGLVCAAGAAATTGALLAAFGSEPPRGMYWPGVLLALVTALALTLRGRTFAEVQHAVPLVAAGSTIGLSLLGVVVFAAPLPQIGAFVAALAVTVAALIFGSLVPTRVFSPVLRRAAELVEYAAIAAVIPLACWVCGLYAAMRGL